MTEEPVPLERPSVEPPEAPRPPETEGRKEGLLQCNRSTYEFAELDDIFRQGVEILMEEEKYRIIWDSGQKERLCLRIGHILAGQEAILSEVASQIVPKGWATSFLWRQLVFTGEMYLPQETGRYKRGIRFCPFFLPGRVNLRRILEREHLGMTGRESRTRVEQEALRVRAIREDEVPFPPFRIERRSSLPPFDPIFQTFAECVSSLKEEREGRIKRLLRLAGVKPETVRAVMEDENMGLNLLAVAMIGRVTRQIPGRERCQPVWGDRIEVKGLKNPELLWRRVMAKHEATRTAEARRSPWYRSWLLEPVGWLREKAATAWERQRIYREERRKREVVKVVGQDINLKSGEILMMFGPNDAGKTNLIRALSANLLANLNASTPFCAQKAHLKRASYLALVAPELRVGLAGGEFRKELTQSRDEMFRAEMTLTQAPPEAGIPLFFFDDFGQFTYPETALPLFFALAERIEDKFPQAAVWINSHYAPFFYQACQKLSLPMPVNFAQIRSDHRPTPWRPEEAYEDLEELIATAIKKGERADLVEKRGEMMGRTDEKTMSAVFGAHQWLDDLVFDLNVARRGERDEVVRRFYQLLDSLSPADFERWQELGSLLDEELCLNIYFGSEGAYQQTRGLALRAGRLGQGLGANHPLNQLRYDLSATLVVAEQRSYRAERLREQSLDRVIAGLALARFCHLLGENLNLGQSGLKGCLGPGLVASRRRSKEKIAPIDLPEEILTGDETVAIIIGANENGKTEALKTLATRIIFDPEEQLGYDYVFFVGRDEDQTIGGELRRLMLQVGHVKARIKEAKARRGDKKRGLVVLDEPCRGTGPDERAQRNAQIIQELREADPEVKIALITFGNLEELRANLEEREISFSTWHVPSRFSRDPDHKPYSLYPGEIDIDNADLIAQFFPELLDRFLYYQALLAERM